MALGNIEISLFASRIEAVCEEMGAVLQRTAFSPNIRDRLDFSCAVFDEHGGLTAQAAHIPVHMGSMAYAMADIVEKVQWQPGDMLVLNDPYLGGTHLPDVTLIAPVFAGTESGGEQLTAFVANRAHHADIGASTPGSMPISTKLEEEGMVIAPDFLMRGHQLQEDLLQNLMAQTSNPRQTRGDFAAQISANLTGLERLRSLVSTMGGAAYGEGVAQLNDYAQRLARQCLIDIPDGDYHFSDVMDDDGLGNVDLPITVRLHVRNHEITVDFSGTAAQTPGNINCPLSVAAAGVYYVFSCLMPSYAPTCEGRFRDISIKAPKGCLLNARYPAAVAAGNVETSTRVVDVIMGALAQAIPQQIPAASHGSMNNIAMGARYGERDGERWDYYETIGGGMGGGPQGAGLSALQTHMTNTRNTPVEVLESVYPVRLSRYQVRTGSGGQGLHNGGDGILREYTFLKNATVTLLTERRRQHPWGLHEGGHGSCGRNRLNGEVLPGKKSFEVKAGDVLCIETPGGGAWGGIPEAD